ncbi:MAG: type II toxin-antitoxin system prevent-host-death family antitoxin, partial [Treponema sp.]|nr:type II toxin-antitoxin system prevent-host-death family antitoxin [Treponema sp.]
MPVIKKSADLRNKYSEISAFCHKYREPIFITKNGEGDLAVMSIETYETLSGKNELYKLIQ